MPRILTGKTLYSCPMNIHTYAAKGDLAGLRAELANGASIEAFNERGRTPLMVAAHSSNADVQTLRFLLDHGANVNALTAPNAWGTKSVLGIAVRSASLEKIKLLVEAGADVRHIDDNGYSILVDAVHRSFPETVDQHLVVLDFLIASGAPLDVTSKYGESALSATSHRGQFDRVKFLLDRGSDPRPLRWTPLFFAVAFGDVQEVRTLLDQGAPLDQRDRSERTPFLLSVHAGHGDIASLLLERGSDLSATGRGGKTALEYAIDQDNGAMLTWLIAQGCDAEETDDHGDFPLLLAAQHGAVRCVEALLEAGASPSRQDQYESGPMSNAASPEIVELLLRAGEDLSDVSNRVRSVLTGLNSREEITVSEEDYRRNRTRRFGQRNPERMNNPFWDEMVRTRAYSYGAGKMFGDVTNGQNPVWSIHRFGQSMTRLPDGRYVEIAGEHEDHYDPDFCIYNDVVIYHGNGSFDILGYPERDFPPTDFHSATLVIPYIYIIGNLGYYETRRPGQTPIYRLHCGSWTIERVPSRGDNPGWIHKHRARLVDASHIEVSGGKVYYGPTTELTDNNKTYLFNLSDLTWHSA